MFTVRIVTFWCLSIHIKTHLTPFLQYSSNSFSWLICSVTTQLTVTAHAEFQQLLTQSLFVESGRIDYGYFNWKTGTATSASTYWLAVLTLIVEKRWMIWRHSCDLTEGVLGIKYSTGCCGSPCGATLLLTDHILSRTIRNPSNPHHSSLYWSCTLYYLKSVKVQCYCRLQAPSLNRKHVF